jgi:hypothetical protein
MKVRDRGQGDPAAHALEQLQAAWEHFHPFGASSTGDKHHEAWRAGTDALAYLPDAEHEVIGIAVGYRQVPRPPPIAPILVMGRKRALRVVVPISTAQANRAEGSDEGREDGDGASVVKGGGARVVAHPGRG